MFHNKNKEHKIPIQKIDTVRIQKSGIPQMTNYLNMKNKETKDKQRNKAN